MFSSAMKLAALQVLFSASLWPATYYVNRSGGSDWRDGQSPTQAWRTLARVAAQALRPGDYVLLKRGEIWQERLSITASGSTDIPVTIGAYGDAPERPVIDGASLSSTGNSELLYLGHCRGVVVRHIEVRNGPNHGLTAYHCSGLVLSDLIVSGNAASGILVYESDHVTIEDSHIFGNALMTSDSYEGIRIDGSGGLLSDFRVRNNVIHDHRGGEGWRSGNGIFLGHTGTSIPTLRNIRITGNDVYANGNPNQNQAGRGITGTFHGDIVVDQNYIHENASAGLYLGDNGTNIDITISNNVFYNNALRQFGGFTNMLARATGNVTFVDDPELTAIGVEIGGDGTWTLERNAFHYSRMTSDKYRCFIRLNGGTQDYRLVSNWNLFYSPTRLPFLDSYEESLDFNAWQSRGFDRDSRYPR